jgi:hypothetical protein
MVEREMKSGNSAGGIARSQDIRWAALELVVASLFVFGANVLDVVPVGETPWLVAIA